jgi:hypothetical protein
MFFAHPQTVRVNHRVIDRNGDYTITDSYDLPGCAISFTGKAGASRTGETGGSEQDTVRASTVLFTPGKPDIRINDTITLLDDGTTWHVWGLPTAFQSPFTGWAPGMQVPLRYYSG